MGVDPVTVGLMMGGAQIGSSIIGGKNASNAADSANAMNRDQFSRSMDYKIWTDQQNAKYQSDKDAWDRSAFNSKSANDWAMNAFKTTADWNQSAASAGFRYGAPGQKVSVDMPKVPTYTAPASAPPAGPPAVYKPGAGNYMPSAANATTTIGQFNKKGG